MSDKRARNRLAKVNSDSPREFNIECQAGKGLLQSSRLTSPFSLSSPTPLDYRLTGLPRSPERLRPNDVRFFRGLRREKVAPFGAVEVRP
jgi:hypothetical protein